jgi:hypothetical protein
VSLAKPPGFPGAASGPEADLAGKCTSDPKIIVRLAHKRACAVDAIDFETGPLSAC